MIIDDKRPTVLKSGVQSSALFNIKKENVAHIFSILRNQLYSDKIRAVIREYSTNAIDAHIEAKVSLPIEINLPNAFFNEFSIRDFGKGLSPDEMVQVFASYGESTKRESNEFTGMLGIGSKSAFAYTNNFTIISRHDGTEYTYGAYIDETNIGTISLISTQSTKETGLSIHITVPEKDWNNFTDSCVDFFQDISYTPKFPNSNEVKVEIEEYKSRLTNTVFGNDWKMVKHPNHSYNESSVEIEMGNVLYPVADEKIGEWFFPREHRFSFNYNNRYCLLRNRNLKLIIHAPIGSVKPSASRESLEYNTATTEYIRQKIVSIFDEIRAEIHRNLKTLPTLYEKHCFANNILYTYGSHYNVDNYAMSVRQDKPHHQSSYKPHDLKVQNLGIAKIREGRFDGQYFFDANEFTPLPNDIYFYNDGSVKANTTTRRAFKYLEDNKLAYNRCFIFTLEDKDKMLKHPSFRDAKFIDLSTIPYIPKESDYVAPKSEKAEVYLFDYADTNIKSWKPAKSLPSNPVYIEISSFKPKDYDNNNLLYRLMGSMSAVGINSFPLHGVKSADIKKTVQPNWIEFKDYVKMELDKWKQDRSVIVEDYNHYHMMNDFWREFISLKESWNHLKKNYSNYKKVYYEYDQLNFLCTSIGIEIFVNKEPIEITRMKEKFPFLNCFNSQIGYSDYLKLIEFLDMS